MVCQCGHQKDACWVDGCHCAVPATLQHFDRMRNPPVLGCKRQRRVAGVVWCIQEVSRQPAGGMACHIQHNRQRRRRASASSQVRGGALLPKRGTQHGGWVGGGDLQTRQGGCGWVRGWKWRTSGSTQSSLSSAGSPAATLLRHSAPRPVAGACWSCCPSEAAGWHAALLQAVALQATVVAAVAVSQLERHGSSPLLQHSCHQSNVWEGRGAAPRARRARPGRARRPLAPCSSRHLRTFTARLLQVSGTKRQRAQVGAQEVRGCRGGERRRRAIGECQKGDRAEDKVSPSAFSIRRLTRRPAAAAPTLCRKGARAVFGSGAGQPIAWRAHTACQRDHDSTPHNWPDHSEVPLVPRPTSTGASTCSPLRRPPLP